MRTSTGMYLQININMKLPERHTKHANTAELRHLMIWGKKAVSKSKCWQVIILC